MTKSKKKTCLRATRIGRITDNKRFKRRSIDFLGKGMFSMACGIAEVV